MHGRMMTAAGATFAVLLMLLGIFAVPGSASAAPTTLNSKLTTATGTTSDFGGGDYFYVKFGSDAAFGIVWGTNDTPNNVYFVAIKARYVGMAQVYDTEGQLVAANQSIKIATVYAVVLDSLVEYNDSNHNGMMQYKAGYAAKNFTETYTTEQIFKRASMRTAWEQSAVIDSSTDTERTWTFDLTAKDLPYQALGNYTGPTGDDKLNEVKLTFHLTASLVQVDNATIPQWRVTVQRGGMGMGNGGMGGMMFNNIEQMPVKTVSGKMLSYHVKWDQSIRGWDFDPNDSNPQLLMQVAAIVGNYLPPAMMAGITWMSMKMLDQNQTNEAGYCRGYSGSEVDVGPTSGMMTAPKPLTSPMLTFGGERTRIGALEWVSNVNVDGNQTQLHAQIMGGVPIVSLGVNGALFAGFAVLGGISFPGGELIVHDPTFTSDALLDVGTGSVGVNIPWGLLSVFVLIMVVVIIVIVAVVLMDKKPGQKQQPPQQNYERFYSSQPGEWAKYYPKK